MNGQNKKDVHTCKSSISLVDFFGQDFPFESKSQNSVKLKTGCVQNVATTWCCGLGRPSLGTDTEDFVLQAQVTLTPPWMRSMLVKLAKF